MVVASSLRILQHPQYWRNLPGRACSVNHSKGLSLRALTVQAATAAPSAGDSSAEVPSESTSAKRKASAHVRRIAGELLALPPGELAELRKSCRERLIAKPSNHKGPLPKNYAPELEIKRSDRPFPMRSSLRNLGSRIHNTLHPAWVFAGQGPSILPVPMPSVISAIMAPHFAELAQQAGPAPSVQLTPETVAPEANSGAEAAETAEAEKPAAPVEEAQKAIVSVKLLSFDATRKIAVVKEVRAMLGQGLKESKELVESAPKVLKKNVPRADAEGFAEKLRAAGAEVSLD